LHQAQVVAQPGGLLENVDEENVLLATAAPDFGIKARYRIQRQLKAVFAALGQTGAVPDEVLGLVALVILLTAGVLICVGAYRRATGPLERAVGLGGLGVMVTIIVHNLFDDIFVHGMEVQMALVLVAVSRVAVGFRPEQEVERVG